VTLVIGLAVSVLNGLFGTQRPAGPAHLPAAPRRFNPLIQNVSFGWLPAGQSLYAGGFLRTEVHLATACHQARSQHAGASARQSSAERCHVRDEGQDRGADADGLTHLRAAAHPVDQRVAGDAVPVAEFPKLLGINLIGQDTQRLVSRLLVAQAAQSVSQPLPAIRHGYHPSPVFN
jgi:hypothetical protein